MFDKLTAMAWGIVLFGVIIVLGSVLLTNFGNSVAQCNTGFNLNTSPNPVVCYNISNSSQPTATPTGNGFTTATYLNTQLGSTSGGLASWTPALIVLGIAVIFIGAFGLVQRGQGRY